jgi:hypothetical protein
MIVKVLLGLKKRDLVCGMPQKLSVRSRYLNRGLHRLQLVKCE